jgi:hypothetical protein
MQTDDQKRGDFTAYLRQLKQSWTINRETEITIMNVILRHKGSELDTYIARFSIMIDWMIKGINNEPDKYSRNPPPDGKCVNSFVGASITTQNYTSNYSLRLSFSQARNEIYRFDVLR